MVPTIGLLICAEQNLIPQIELARYIDIKDISCFIKQFYSEVKAKLNVLSFQ